MGARPFSPRRQVAAEPAQALPAPASGEIRAEGRGREAAALLLFAVSCFLCLALGSFRLDPSNPTVTGPDWVGPVGALVTSVLIQTFGIMT